MNTELLTDTVVLATPWCTVREQEEQYLIYNTRTDELHLIPPAGYYAYRLCDGARTLGEVEAELRQVIPAAPSDLHERWCGFLTALIERGVLEVGDAP